MHPERVNFSIAAPALTDTALVDALGIRTTRSALEWGRTSDWALRAHMLQFPNETRCLYAVNGSRTPAVAFGERRTAKVRFVRLFGITVDVFNCTIEPRSEVVDIKREWGTASQWRTAPLDFTVQVMRMTCSRDPFSLLGSLTETWSIEPALQEPTLLDWPTTVQSSSFRHSKTNSSDNLCGLPDLVPLAKFIPESPASGNNTNATQPIQTMDSSTTSLLLHRSGTVFLVNDAVNGRTSDLRQASVFDLQGDPDSIGMWCSVALQTHRLIAIYLVSQLDSFLGDHDRSSFHRFSGPVVQLALLPQSVAAYGYVPPRQPAPNCANSLLGWRWQIPSSLTSNGTCCSRPTGDPYTTGGSTSPRLSTSHYGVLGPGAHCWTGTHVMCAVTSTPACYLALTLPIAALSRRERRYLSPPRRKEMEPEPSSRRQHCTCTPACSLRELH